MHNTMRVLISAAMATFLVACVFAIDASSQANQYYVSPEGSDSNDGSFDAPWRSVAQALNKLAAGDTLNLRGGTYYERGLVVRLKGTAEAPITIRSYPGERAVIDGSMPYFRDIPNAEWELVDSATGLYRSQRTLDGNLVRAWLVDDGVQLVEYESAANLESTNYGPIDGMNPLYTGPGLQLRSDGRIYIRLQYNPNDLTDAAGNPIAPVPANTDPNHNRLAVFTATYLLMLDGAEHLVLQDLVLAHAQRLIDVRKGSQHVEVDGCRLIYGTYGINTREGSTDWQIHGSEFDNGVPDYLYWTDVKNRDNEVAEAFPEFQSTALIGSMSGFNIHDNVFTAGFDGVRVEEGTVNARISDNTFTHLRDDAINLRMGVGNVEVAHNLFWRVASGIANLGSEGTPGPVYIHHNIIDNSAYQRGGRPGNYRAENWPTWTVIDPFGSHDSGNKASHWKVYNNTIVTRGSGYPRSSAGPRTVIGNAEKYVYNNIFFILDDRVIFRDDLATSGAHYDGNVMFRLTPGRFPLFVRFADGKDYASLTDFRRDSASGWEEHGLEIDPGFSIDDLIHPSYDPATIRQRYQPMAPEVNTPGASYEGLDWPGTAGVDYRGAVPPSPSPLEIGHGLYYLLAHL